MDVIELNEEPSSARRRLSVILSEDGTSDESLRRLSSILRLVPSISEDRVSIVGRRASAMSRVLAFAITSESFHEEDIPPTIINAMLFLRDPNPDIGKIRQVMADRLLDVPRFRSTVRQDDDGSMHWDPIPRDRVDMKHHVRVMDGGGEFDMDGIEDLLNESFNTQWSLDKPPWQMTLVKNLKDGRSLLYCFIDHAIGDGVAMLAVMLSLLDDPGDGTEKVKSYQKRRTRGPSLRWSHRAVCFLRGIPQGIQQTFAPANDVQSSLKIPNEKLSSRGPGKIFLQTKSLDVDEVKALKNKIPGAVITVNDLILTIVTIGFRKFFEESSDPVMESVQRGGVVRAEFPVNMRTKTGNDSAVTNFGNEITFASFPFPLDYTDAIDALWRCKTQVDELKVSPCFPIKKKLSDMLLMLVPDELLAPKMHETSNRATCMISNVMGPQDQQMLAGYVLDDLDFSVTFPAGMYIGVLSYNNKLQISIILDKRVDAAADGSLLKKSFEAAFEELKSAINHAETLTRPDMTPLSARCLELLVYAASISVPVLLAMWAQHK